MSWNAALDGVVYGQPLVVNGRIFAAQVAEGKPFQIVWDGQIYENEMYVIPKGAPNMEEAKQFIAYQVALELVDVPQVVQHGGDNRVGIAERRFEDAQRPLPGISRGGGFAQASQRFRQVREVASRVGMIRAKNRFVDC